MNETKIKLKGTVLEFSSEPSMKQGHTIVSLTA